MPQVRLTMRKIREILRLRYVGRRTQREIGLACRISSSTVWDTLRRFKASTLTWPLPDELTDEELESELYPSAVEAQEAKLKPVPDWAEVQREKKKAKNVTLCLLWEEYKTNNPDGYEYSWFCANYRAWLKTVEPVMRQSYRFGDKCFVDYAGETVPIVDPKTGEVQAAEIFVGTMGASNYTYAEAQRSQELSSWIMGHVRMFKYFGAVPEALVPDNLKSGVKSPDFYDPDLNPTYHALAEHYKVAVIPARVRKPRDKAKVENAVLQVERWVLARLRNRVFHSLEELNEAIAELLEELNERSFQKLPGCRREMFEQEELPRMRRLPAEPFVYVHRKGAKVAIDYHVEYDHHYYSVPYGLVRQKVEIFAGATTIEIVHNGLRVASHRRSFQRGGFTTDDSHRHPKHRRELEWTPKRFRSWGSKLGPNVELMVTAILHGYKYPEHGFRRCLGLLSLEKTYGRERLDAACKRGLAVGGLTYQSVKSILQKKLDLQAIPSVETQSTEERRLHYNIRGAEYYR